VYEAADAALASIVERAPDDAAVFVLSPDGMAANYRTYEAFGAVLEAGGWLVRHPHPPGPAGAAQTLRRAVHRVVPLAARRQLARLAPGQAQRLQAVTRNVDVDWSRTAAFTIPHDHNSLVRVNLAGREPQGCVEPGAAYDRLCDELAERASALVDDASGRPVVERVLRVDRVIGGPVGDVLADLVVLWEPTWPGAISGPGIPAVTVPHEDARTGIHPPRGFVIGAGPGITPGGLERGERAEAPAAPAAHVDLAPTLLARLGAPIPPTLPGRVLPELAP
jgi:predicted AlkP superfamily phosphohydrolase/phosphomutase